MLKGKESWSERQSQHIFFRKKKSQFVVESFQIMCHFYSKTAALHLVRPICWCQICQGFFFVLFKVCQKVHRRECVSSLLFPEPLVSHYITNLPSPAVCADPATKNLLPGCSAENCWRPFVPRAIRLQTLQSFLPHWPQPQPATMVLELSWMVLHFKLLKSPYWYDSYVINIYLYDCVC